jgi:hypothetical protein
MWSGHLSLPEVMAHLTRILDAREGRQECFVIVEVGEGNRFVQFYFDEDQIYGEAVGSFYLTAEGHPSLSQQQHELLGWLGWEGPADPRSKDERGDGHGNYFRNWSYDTPTDAVVMDLMRTLVSVYMAGEGQHFELYRSWDEPADWVDQIPA